MLPGLAQASSGGAALAGGLGAGAATPPPAPGTSTPSTSPVVVQPGNVIVSASGNGITIVTHSSAFLNNKLSFTGKVSPAAAGRVVEIERRGRETNWAWAPTTHGSVRRNGSFSAIWPTNHIGQFAIRAVVAGTLSARPHTAAASAALTVIVYRPAIATWYGPGFFSQRTACGEKLQRSTLGVANRTLKCGTLVSIYYRGHTIVVPVIDRGPYANGADWDLTEATATALGIADTVTIGAVSLPRT